MPFPSHWLPSVLTIVEKMDSSENGMNPVTIISLLKEYWPVLNPLSYLLLSGKFIVAMMMISVFDRVETLWEKEKCWLAALLVVRSGGMGLGNLFTAVANHVAPSQVPCHLTVQRIHYTAKSKIIHHQIYKFNKFRDLLLLFLPFL